MYFATQPSSHDSAKLYQHTLLQSAIGPADLAQSTSSRPAISSAAVLLGHAGCEPGLHWVLVSGEIERQKRRERRP